jgi:hypothetical protein
VIESWTDYRGPTVYARLMIDLDAEQVEAASRTMS